MNANGICLFFFSTPPSPAPTRGLAKRRLWWKEVHYILLEALEVLNYVWQNMDESEQEARLQQYVNHELPDVQAGFRKGRITRDQIANYY